MTQTQDLDALIAEAREVASDLFGEGYEERAEIITGLLTALREENERLRKALNVAGGNIVNVRYGLMTGDTKAKSAAYLDGAHKRVQSALNPTGGQ